MASLVARALMEDRPIGDPPERGLAVDRVLRVSFWQPRPAERPATVTSITVNQGKRTPKSHG